jgi:hypothetical protein
MASMAAIAGSAKAAPAAERPKRALFDRDASSPANFAQQTAWVWRDMPAPVIAIQLSAAIRRPNSRAAA